MPATTTREETERELRIELMTVQKPWKAMAIAFGAGAAFMGAIVGLLTLILKH